MSLPSPSHLGFILQPVVVLQCESLPPGSRVLVARDSVCVGKLGCFADARESCLENVCPLVGMSKDERKHSKFEFRTSRLHRGSRDEVRRAMLAGGCADRITVPQSSRSSGVSRKPPANAIFHQPLRQSQTLQLHQGYRFPCCQVFVMSRSETQLH